MIEDFTLIILTHNRPVYLDRLLEFYAGGQLEIIIADSSAQQNLKVTEKSNGTLRYCYFPGLSLNNKINRVLEKVTTKYCAFCGDDDFTVISGIKECISFLKTNPDYSVAHGYRIIYAKDYLPYDKLYFQLLFSDSLDFSVTDDEPLKRIETFFANYKSIFYGVHYTENLIQAFNDLYKISDNNYLNEYVTGIFPLAAGKYKEINCLYSILEGSSSSDGNIARNLRVLYSTEEGKKLVNMFIDVQAAAICKRLHADNNIVRNSLAKSLDCFAELLQRDYINSGKISMKKRIGNFIGKTGFAGKLAVNISRRIEMKSAVSNLPFTKEVELNEIDSVGRLIKKYGFIK